MREAETDSVADGVRADTVALGCETEWLKVSEKVLDGEGEPVPPDSVKERDSDSDSDTVIATDVREPDMLRVGVPMDAEAVASSEIDSVNVPADFVIDLSGDTELR